MDNPPTNLYTDDVAPYKGSRGNFGIFDKGPFGLGDPGDKSISKAEWEVVIPNVKREIIERDYCTREHNEVSRCYQEHNFFTRFFKCTDDRHCFNECFNYWKDNNEVLEKTIAEYVEERTLFRSTAMNKLERENFDKTVKERSKVGFIRRRETPLPEEERKLPVYRLYINELKRLYNEMKEKPES